MRQLTATAVPMQLWTPVWRDPRLRSQTQRWRGLRGQTQFLPTALSSSSELVLSSRIYVLVLPRTPFEIASEALSQKCDNELKQNLLHRRPLFHMLRQRNHRCRHRRLTSIEPPKAAALLPVYMGRGLC